MADSSIPLVRVFISILRSSCVRLDDGVLLEHRRSELVAPCSLFGKFAGWSQVLRGLLDGFFDRREGLIQILGSLESRIFIAGEDVIFTT